MKTLRGWLVVAVAATVAGCATAPTAVFAPTASPRAESLSYFPGSAPLVALVDTDLRPVQLAVNVYNPDYYEYRAQLQGRPG